jgi:hypothetical protein
MAASMPVRRPRRKSGTVTSCPKDTGGAELHKRSAEASGFDRTARRGRAGQQREDALGGEFLIERTQTQEPRLPESELSESPCWRGALALFSRHYGRSAFISSMTR